MEGIHSRAGMKVSASQAPGDHPGFLTPMHSQQVIADAGLTGQTQELQLL